MHRVVRDRLLDLKESNTNLIALLLWLCQCRSAGQGLMTPPSVNVAPR